MSKYATTIQPIRVNPSADCQCVGLSPHLFAQNIDRSMLSLFWPSGTGKQSRAQRPHPIAQ